MIRLSRIPHLLLTCGLPVGPLVLLRTRGRHSGLPRTVPVATLRHDGHQWLVSPFGDTHWVRNLRADGRAELGRGHRFRPVRLVEVDDDRKPEILRAYRRAFGLVPFVRDAFDAGADDRPQVFAIEVHRHPAFLIQPAG
ncbi:nitroreductase family deazaflavin-dependent oxidoreductase [Nonomuraea basaltis]|uniref:nitroreductase family deazaflavin-dependent oxidoreductase n=1 Tax=Nonomuraea basaltis TaxID=2495887 RepID=UPI00110C664D|nr:nitroreductase family deazaflavin-dependent oxidoreductase [Nonomuraea basaltis]TMR94005.1 nitroreductase family deazaflavin-dependent oxidoreductase [Nonomuraea basaltis]